MCKICNHKTIDKCMFCGFPGTKKGKKGKGKTRKELRMEFLMSLQGKKELWKMETTGVSTVDILVGAKSRQSIVDKVNGLVEKAINFIDCSRPGVCILVAECICREFLNNGILDFHVVEGYVITGEVTNAHTWIKHSIGVIDPSIIQFPEGRKYSGPYKKYDPKIYLEM